MNRIIYSLVILLFVTSCTKKDKFSEVQEKPRILIFTDIGGDPDDQQSMVRLLVHSNEFDIEGLIATASGTPGELGIDTVKVQLLKDYVIAYGKVYNSLKKHSEDFPEPDYLMSRVRSGNLYRGLDHIGEGHDTEATDFIIELIDKEKTGKLNICIWGGQTDFVQALWKVRHLRTHDEYLEFVSKLRIYDVLDQDGIYSHIKSEFPELFYILSKAPEGTDKREGVYRGMYLGGDEELTSKEWVSENVINGHGPLGEIYPDKTWTAPNPHRCLKEGDTPSWFYFLQNGLQDPDQPSWGGWGGRYQRDTLNYFVDASDFVDGVINPRSTVSRWREYYQNEFSARMDWCVQSFEQANHRPEVYINGMECKYPLIMEVNEGDSVVLDAFDTYNPDNNKLEYYWWTYPEAGTNNLCPELENFLSPEVSLVIPEGESGREIHLICQISDNGTPALTGFGRIVLRIE